MNRLMRSKRDRVFLGVCGGIGEYFNIDPTLIRLAFIFFVFMSMGLAVLVYIIAGFVMPERDSIDYDTDDDLDRRNDQIRRNTPIVIGLGLILWGIYLLTKLVFPNIFYRFIHQFRSIWNFWPVLLILLGLYVIYQNRNK